MNKTYIQPTIRYSKLDTEGVIAQSGPVHRSLNQNAKEEYKSTDPFGKSNADTRGRIGGGNIWNN